MQEEEEALDLEEDSYLEKHGTHSMADVDETIHPILVQNGEIGTADLKLNITSRREGVVTHSESVHRGCCSGRETGGPCGGDQRGVPGNLIKKHNSSGRSKTKKGGDLMAK